MRRDDQEYVDQLSPGDRFEWCGRTVEIESIEPGKRYRDRPSRFVRVRLGEKQLRLHYYDHELLTVREGAR